MIKFTGVPLKGILLVTIWLLSSSSQVAAEPGRWEKDISGSGWRLWLDREADWKNDDIYLPPVDISALPVNPPTCGWEYLGIECNKEVSVPGTVEEYFWSANGNPNGTAGDYRGVSWWSTTFSLEPSLRGKRITLAFDSVNLRAEVFVNKKLAGYDVIGNTPFDVDITDSVTFDGENRLDVRITDPVGTFSWDDETQLPWGDNGIPSVHGFGGITGKIIIQATDDIHVDDIYVQNQPDSKKAKVFVSLCNTSGAQVDGNLTLVVHEWGNSTNVLWKKSVSGSVPTDGKEFTFDINAPKAKLWDILDPNLYAAAVTFTSKDGVGIDSTSRKFGFRFFTVGEKNGDKRFYLNGKRVYIIAAMTRGFWAKSGMFPTPGMAERDMKAVIDMGCNMMLYHRAIGQPISMDVADDMGIMTYEEPGGYQCLPAPDKTVQNWRKEKLRRMVIRDRSRPSMVIFNLDDWSYSEPNDWDRENIRMVHTLDPSRIITFNCISIPAVPNVKDNPFKLHMLPFDDTFHYHGWLDPYHFAPQAGYVDQYYNNPRYYLRNILDPDRNTMGDSLDVVPKDEIIFYGEEGAFGTIVSLEKIKNELARTGASGWRESEHLAWFNSYDRFLDESGMRSSFPTVDDLTMALGVNLHYFHGRIIENTRIMNTADSYVLNGWASASTNTDIVDAYRNPTADPSILRHYTQPLYIAVKIRDKVLPAGATQIADIFIVNEKNLKGNHTLELVYKNPEGNIIFSKSYKSKILGGEEFGQLLVEDVRLPEVASPGYYVLRATLKDGKGSVKATGFDDIFTVDYKTGPGIKGTVAVIDTSGVINSFLKKARGITLPEFDPIGQVPDCIVFGAHDYRRIMSIRDKRWARAVQPIMEMVKNGTTLVILDNADSWASSRLPVKYTGMVNWGSRGRQFVGDSSLIQGLPKSQAMNWEYQVFYQRDVRGLSLSPVGVETIVGFAGQHTDEIAMALCRVPYGNGHIILSTLRILPELLSEKPQSATAKKLFMNLLEYSY